MLSAFLRLTQTIARAWRSLHTKQPMIEEVNEGIGTPIGEPLFIALADHLDPQEELRRTIKQHKLEGANAFRGKTAGEFFGLTSGNGIEYRVVQFVQV